MNVSIDLAPPEPCPPQHDQIRKELDTKAYESYVSNRVPWKVIEQIRYDRHTTVTQGANRFQDSADLRARGPDELELDALGYGPRRKSTWSSPECWVLLTK